jgi:hypothetical protein
VKDTIYVIEESKRKTIQMLLSDGFEFERISSITGVPIRILVQEFKKPTKIETEKQKMLRIQKNIRYAEQLLFKMAHKFNELSETEQQLYFVLLFYVPLEDLNSGRLQMIDQILDQSLRFPLNEI